MGLTFFAISCFSDKFFRCSNYQEFVSYYNKGLGHSLQLKKYVLRVEISLKKGLELAEEKHLQARNQSITFGNPAPPPPCGDGQREEKKSPVMSTLSPRKGDMLLNSKGEGGKEEEGEGKGRKEILIKMEGRRKKFSTLPLSLFFPLFSFYCSSKRGFRGRGIRPTG